MKSVKGDSRNNVHCHYHANHADHAHVFTDKHDHETSHATLGRDGVSLPAESDFSVTLEM